MGLIDADIELANTKNGSLKSMIGKALVDTGAMTLHSGPHRDSVAVTGNREAGGCKMGRVGSNAEM